MSDRNPIRRNMHSLRVIVLTVVVCLASMSLLETPTQLAVAVAACALGFYVRTREPQGRACLFQDQSLQWW